MTSRSDDARRRRTPLASRATLVSRLGLALALVCAVVPGCRARAVNGPPQSSSERAYPDGADGLAALFRDVLVASQQDDRERVQALFASTEMSRADLAGLFGDARAAWLAPRYAKVFDRFARLGALELVAQVIEHRYDDVEVLRVEPSQGREQAAVLAALVAPTPLYAVRIKRKSDTRGLRYDYFARVRDRWVTANQMGAYFLDDRLPAPAAPAAPSSDAATHTGP